MAYWRVVADGEDILQIASEEGFEDWTLIWDHPENVTYRSCNGYGDGKSCAQGFALEPGMRIYIPDRQSREESGATEKCHIFEMMPTQKQLRLRLCEGDTALAGEKYILMVEGEQFEGKTDADGFLSHVISGSARNGRLTFSHLVIDLDIGGLDPASTARGIQARLNNLGFDVGRVDGDIGANTKGAVKSFQSSHHLTVNGVPGPDTQDKLIAVHGI